MKPHSLRILFAVSAFSALPAAAQFTYPGCDTLRSTEFEAVELFNKSGTNGALATHAGLNEPVQFDLQGVMNAAGDSTLYTNIYFVERRGKVKFYNGLTKVVDSVGYVPNWAGQQSGNAGNNDNGLMGLALDPKFNTNKWIYFWYSPSFPDLPATGASSPNRNRRLRLSRITVNAQNKLDMSTEKILIDVLGSKVDDYHAGGPMTFDRDGNLLVTIGNNSKDLSGQGNQYSTTDSSNSGEWGSGNTASIRGGVIRIRPDDTAKAVHVNRSGTYGPGYTIPSGNFGEYWGNYFQGKGNNTLAAEYRDTAKVRPEVYVKGTRSNYSIAVHPTKGWVGWGEVNYSTTNDEFNLVDHPVFSGMPYFHKNNVATPAGSIAMPVGHSVETPINNSPLNSGVKNLPPVQGPVLYYGSTTTTTTINHNVSIGGPFYMYNRNLKSSVKFPPHLNNTWVLMNAYNNPDQGGMWIVPLDSTTPNVAGAPQKQGNTGTIRFTIRNPVHAKYGTDGALYMLYYGSTASYASNNNPGAVRVTYTGSCKLAPVAISPVQPLSELRMSLTAGNLQILEAGRHEITVLSADGREVFRAAGEAGATYRLADMRAARGGVYILRVKTAQGLYARNLPML